MTELEFAYLSNHLRDEPSAQVRRFNQVAGGFAAISGTDDMVIKTIRNYLQRNLSYSQRGCGLCEMNVACRSTRSWQPPAGRSQA